MKTRNPGMMGEYGGGSEIENKPQYCSECRRSISPRTPCSHMLAQWKAENKTLKEHNEAVERVRLARGRGLSPEGLADALDITDAAYDAEREMRLEWRDLASQREGEIKELEAELKAERGARVKAERKLPTTSGTTGPPVGADR